MDVILISTTPNIPFAIWDESLDYLPHPFEPNNRGSSENDPPRQKSSGAQNLLHYRMRV
jgi:hypothetical protein